MKVIIYGEEYQCFRAVKGSDYVELYDDTTCIAKYSGISSFEGYEIEGGEWETPEPTQEDDINAMIVDHELRLTMLELGLDDF
jgi:hypothetical protein